MRVSERDVATWKNRIVGEGEQPASQFIANPDNWRTHPQHQRDAMRGALNEVGWVQRVIVNRRTGYLVDGHERVWQALQNGDAMVPYVEVDLSEQEEAYVLATLDPIGAMATADAAKLDELLREVESGEAGVQAMLADLASEAGLYEEPKEAPEPQVDKAEELREKWQTERGQLWEIGKHRLMCGDSTSEADVARLMREDSAEMVWTDPPYGVAVGDKNKMLNAIARSNRVEENLAGDTLDEHGLVAMLTGAFDAMIAHCTAGAAWYVAAPAGPLHVLFGQVLKDRGIWRQTIQWVKNNATFSPMGVDYHWRAEPIFYGWLPNAGHRYYGGRKQDTVWEIDRPAKSPEHPTMKPVELVARAIENSSRAGEIVADMFLGSGTTMVAAEQLGRVCYAMEIEPKYVAVTLERMSAMGLEPRLVDDGQAANSN
jgi:DNA modification methylase